MIKSVKGLASSVPRWIAALMIGAALAGALRGIADDVHFNAASLTQAFTADAGWEASVPREVVEARQMLERHDARRSSIALEPKLEADPLLRQRMWEGLYPQRLHESTTGLMLWKAPGPSASACTVIERSELLVLADCN